MSIVSRESPNVGIQPSTRQRFKQQRAADLRRVCAYRRNPVAGGECGYERRLISNAPDRLCPASGSVASTSNIPANLSAIRVVVDDDTNLNVGASDSTPPQTVQHTFSSTPTTIPILSAPPGSVSEGVNAEFKVDVRSLMGMIPNQWRVVPSLSSSVGGADFASGLLPQGGLSYVDGVASVQATATADSIPELAESNQFQIGTGNSTSFFTVAAATVNVTDPAGTPPPLVARRSNVQGNKVFIAFSGPVHVNGSATRLLIRSMRSSSRF